MRAHGIDGDGNCRVFLSFKSAIALLSSALIQLASCSTSLGGSGPELQRTLPKTDKEIVRVYLEQVVLAAADTRDHSSRASPELMGRLQEAIGKKGDAILDEFVSQFRALEERSKAWVLTQSSWPIITPKAFAFVAGQLQGLDRKSLEAATLLGDYKYVKARPRIRALYDEAMRQYRARARPRAAVNALNLLGTALMQLGDLEPVLRTVRRLMRESSGATKYFAGYYACAAQEICIGRKTRLGAGPIVDRLLRTKAEKRWLLAFQLNAALRITSDPFSPDPDMASILKRCDSPAGRRIRYRSWVDLSSLACRHKDHDLALLCSKKALELVPGDRTARYATARALNRLRRYKEALAIVDELVAEDRKEMKAQFLRAEVQINQGRLEVARGELDRLSSSWPDHPLGLALRIKLELRSGNSQAASTLAGQLAELLLSPGRVELEGSAELPEVRPGNVTSAPAR